jgi:hypothetical protein
LLGYYTDDGKLTYAGRVGTGMPDKVLADLRRRLEPLARKTSPLGVLPPRKTRFGSPLVLSRVHWVDPKLVAEITYLTWTSDGLLRHTIYVGLRGQAGGSGAARSRTRLIRGSGQGSINQRQSGVDVDRTLQIAALDALLGRVPTLPLQRLNGRNPARRGLSQPLQPSIWFQYQPHRPFPGAVRRLSARPDTLALLVGCYRLETA